jgi:hypothetical protein
MGTIQAIQSTTLSIELKIKEMQETFNVLEEHRIQVNERLLQARKKEIEFLYVIFFHHHQ